MMASESEVNLINRQKGDTIQWHPIAFTKPVISLYNIWTNLTQFVGM